MNQLMSFDETAIAYSVFGSGPPVLLLHGFAADHVANWKRPKAIDALVAAGRQVVAYDARGHGASGRPHEPEGYDDNAMVRDAKALLDHLGIEQVDVVGYSMGAMVAARLVSDEPRARSVVLGGVGGNATPPRRGGAESVLAAALLADDIDSITEPLAKGFRLFAEATGADRKALAAIERSNALRSPVRFEAITIPALVLAGDADALIRPPQELAQRLPDARLVIVRGDHLTVVGNPAFTRAILDFLDEISTVSPTRGDAK